MTLPDLATRTIPPQYTDYPKTARHAWTVEECLQQIERRLHQIEQRLMNLEVLVRLQEDDFK